MTETTEKTKRPAFQFYPADWRKDVELQSCSMAAQGLWINAMCIAHECEPYGHLMVNGRPMNTAQLGRQVGLSVKECEGLVSELLDAGVARRTEEGALFSKRMVQDETTRNARAAGGKTGAEHGAKGASHGKKGGRPSQPKGGSETPLTGNGNTPLPGFEEPPPSSSSSSSTSLNSVPDGTGGQAATSPGDMARDELWKAGKSLLAQAGMPAAQCGSFVGKLVKDYGDAVVVEAVRAAVVTRPADPVSYLKAACQGTAGERRQPNRQEALETRNRNVADAWAAGGDDHAGS
ncbi:hypothetical protein ACF8PL_18955 [Delftia sp. WSY_4]|uniref:hypothetical protein n=1 Tax=unclassified Delftia TaxID=2613839 RepID=UPI00370C020A